MDEKSYSTPIINNQVGSVNLTIILRMFQGIQDVVPVILNNLTLPGKHSAGFMMSNDSHSVVLGRENVSISPMDVTAEDLDILNQHFRLDVHVYRSIDTGATRHLRSL